MAYLELKDKHGVSYPDMMAQPDAVEIAINNSLQMLNTDMIVLCYGNGGVEGAAAERGFAWIDLDEVKNVASGEKGRNWYSFIKALYWLLRNTIGQDPREASPLPTDGDPHRF